MAGKPKPIAARPNQKPMDASDFWSQIATKQPGAISDEMRAFAKSQLKGKKGRK